MSQPGDRSDPDGHNVLKEDSNELVGIERKERASALSRKAKTEEMTRGIVFEVLEKVDTIHMVRDIILEEVNRLDGWMMVRDSMETVLEMTWSMIRARNIWEEICTKPEVQNIILANMKTQRDEAWSEMMKVKRIEKAERLTAEAREKELTRQFLETASLENDIDNISTYIAMFNPYSGRMNESMNISIDLEDLQDHLELKEYVMDLDISLETLIFDSQMEMTAHDELDNILRGALEDDDVKMAEVEEEDVMMNLEAVDIDSDEWLELEMTEMYWPQLVTQPSCI